MNSQMNCSALDTSAAESNTVKIPARRRATRRRHQRGRKQVICADPSGDTGSGSCVDTQVQAATGNRSATNLARTKPLGGLPRRTGQHGRCPGATCSVRVSSGSADTVFGRVTPSPPTHYRNRLMKVHVVDGQGRVRVQLGKPAHLHRNSRWHDSLQANGGVRRVVGRLGKGGHGLERRVVWQGISSGQPTRRYFRGDGGGSTAQD